MGTRSAISNDLDDLAKRLARLAREKRLTVVAAESCTGGLLAQILCDAPGATDFFHGSFVTYTKLQKIRALGVPADLLQRKAQSAPRSRVRWQPARCNVHRPI